MRGKLCVSICNSEVELENFGKCLSNDGAIFGKWIEEFGEFSGRWSWGNSVVTRLLSEVSRFFGGFNGGV